MMTMRATPNMLPFGTRVTVLDTDGTSVEDGQIINNAALRARAHPTAGDWNPYTVRGDSGTIYACRPSDVIEHDGG